MLQEFVCVRGHKQTPATWRDEIDGSITNKRDVRGFQRLNLPTSAQCHLNRKRNTISGSILRHRRVLHGKFQTEEACSVSSEKLSTTLTCVPAGHTAAAL